MLLFKIDPEKTVQMVKNSLSSIDSVIDKLVAVLSQDITTQGIWTVVQTAVEVSTSIAIVLVVLFWLVTFLNEILEKEWRSLSLSWYFRKLCVLIFAETIIKCAPDVIIMIYNFVAWAMQQYNINLGASNLFNSIDFTAFKDSLEGMGFCEHLWLRVEIYVPSILIRLAGAIIQIIVWFRILQICMLTIISPIPFSTFVNERHSGVFAFIKESIAVCGQAIIMILACELYKGMVVQIVGNTVTDVGSIWQLCVATLVLLITIMGSQKLAGLFLGR